MMGKEKLILDTVQSFVNGETIFVHKELGAVRKNCRFISGIEDIPEFLLEDGAVEINDNGSVVLFEPGHRAVRRAPFFLCWKKASEEELDEVPGAYASWCKHNGSTTLKVVGGKCYNAPTQVRCALVLDKLPIWVANSRFPVARDGDYMVLYRSDFGEKWSGKCCRSLWMDYGNKGGGLDIMSVHAHAVSEYIVTRDEADLLKLAELLKLADLL